MDAVVVESLGKEYRLYPGSMARVNRADPAPSATVGEWLRAWWTESVTAPRVFSWWQPFRWRLLPDTAVGEGTHTGRRAVVLVHGFVCNRGLWMPWLRVLRAREVPYATVSLEPVFGSIDAYVPQLEAAIERATRATGQPPLVVAHSMGGLAVRAWLPHSRQAWLVYPENNQARPMRRIHPAGLFEAVCPMPSDDQVNRYQLRVAEENGDVKTMHDPYAFDSLFTEYDFHLFGEGRHEKIYERLGAQLRTVDGVAGVNFSVWAPDAMSVSLVGDFNQWGRSTGAFREFAAGWRVPAIGNSFPSRRPIAPLDRIVHSPEWTCHAAAPHHSALAVVASDHLPVRATLELRA